MPHIQMSDQQGRQIVIDSSDPELIAKWVVETLPKTGASNIFPSQVVIYPCFIYDPSTGQSAPDWPPNVAHTFRAQLESNGVDGVRRLISELRRYLEAVEK